jgi:hypothetical protein
MLKKPENVSSSFDRLRMRSSLFKGLNLMVSLSGFDNPFEDFGDPSPLFMLM